MVYDIGPNWQPTQVTNCVCVKKYTADSKIKNYYTKVKRFGKNGLAEVEINT